MIHVIAMLEVAPGRRDEFLAAFKELVPAVLAEEGCIEYAPAIDATTPLDFQVATGDNVLTVVEKWESLAALEAHLAAPHVAEFRRKAEAILVGLKAYILEPA